MERSASDRTVATFRHSLLWPLRLAPLGQARDASRHWEQLAPPWGRVGDELDDPAAIGERHYREFVAFLPYVQRMLYGEGEGASCPSPIQVFRRRDVTRLRLLLTAEQPAIELAVVHVDLYFFHDIDVAILNVELAGERLPLEVVQETLRRFGCAFPPGWDSAGQPLACPQVAEWLAGDGTVLARSDYEMREQFVAAVQRYRMPRFAAHWAFLLAPMVPDRPDRQGVLRYRVIDDFRIPTLAFVALEDPAAVTRADYIRLAFNVGRGQPDELPYPEAALADFERRHCLDRLRDKARDGRAGARLMCVDSTVVMIGDAHAPGFVDAERGELGRFRHEYFLICLVAQFHKATLLALADRMANAIDRLDIHALDTVRGFKREIRHLFEVFLRFSHRYWFHELSEQRTARQLHELLSRELQLAPLYAEVEKELEAMARYLDSDALRRQANTLLRLTVVTIFGLVGTVTTGFLGMNIFSMDELPSWEKLFWLLFCFAGVIAVTAYTITRSRRLSDFLDALSDERVGWRGKAGALVRVWRR